MRLIDADALITEAFDLMDRDELLEDVPQIIKDYCDAQPTVDAVPVVRCRDCMWYVIDELKSDETPDRRYKPTFCELHRTWMPSDGFCSEGKEEKR